MPGVAISRSLEMKNTLADEEAPPGMETGGGGALMG
jgi:hypothetical protein